MHWKYNLKFNKYNIVYILIFLIVFSMIFVSYGITYIIIMALLTISTLILLYMKIKWSNLFTLEMIFIIFSFFQYLFNITTSRTDTIEMTIRLMICLVGEIVVYNLLMAMGSGRKGNENIFACYANIYEVAMLAILILIYFLIGFDGSRLSTRGLDFSILGISISVGTSTTIGYLAGLSFAASYIVFIWKRRNYHIFFIILSSVLILLSGSRKEIVLCAIIIIAAPVIKNRNYKRVLSFLGLLVLIGILFLLIINIPILYQTIGARLIRGINGVLTGDLAGTSDVTRAWLRSTAFEQFQSRPIVGWGLDTFQSHYAIRYSHCNYTEILYSSGIIGSIIFFSKYFFLIYKVLKARQCAKNNDSRYMINNVTILFFTLLVLEYWQVTYYRSQFTIIYIFILAYCDNLIKNENNQNIRNM